MSHGAYLQWAQERNDLRTEIERLQTGWDLATKAVDENQSLRAEIERLVSIVAARNNENGLLRAEIERLQKDNHRLMMWNEELQARCDALAGRER
jgi:chromosome segregation ATPase